MYATTQRSREKVAGRHEVRGGIAREGKRSCPRSFLLLAGHDFATLDEPGSYHSFTTQGWANAEPRRHRSVLSTQQLKAEGMEMWYVLWRNLTISSLLLLFHLCVPPFTLPLASASASNAASLATFLQTIKRDSSEGSCVPSVEDSNVAGCPSTFCGAISCTADGSVEVVDLSGGGLTGTIPLNSLGALKMLKSLNLSNNLFSGTLPDDLGSLHQLEHMDLSQNKFSGPIPLKFSGLESLITLTLAVNQLSGSIPPSLGELQHLTSLNLSSNRFTDHIPKEISSLASLTSLDLHSNQLSGQIDSSFLALSSLTTVDFSSNKLSGFIPWQPNDTLPLLRTVEYVNLSHNQLTGPLVPEKFASMFAESLRVLDMSHNQLSGSLPDFEFVLVLEVLRLSNNYLTGALPHTLFSATPLEELDLSNNSLTGGIPRVLSTSLKVLNLSFNSLTGTIPPKIGACAVVDLSHNMLQGDLSLMQYWSEMLEILDLSFNNLNGALVDLDIKFVRLTALNLSHNKLYGAIPSSYGLFPKLNLVDLSFNQLNGTIPVSFLNSSTLSYLSVSNNLLAGSLHIEDTVSFTSVLNYPPSSLSQFPLQTGQVSPLIALHLSGNKLDGNIPGGIARYQKLEELDLSENLFSGKMPSALCNLTMLRVLDLSSNTLSGSIPTGLSSSLLVLHLANNNLSGLIPKDLIRFPNTSFFPGNEGLVSSWLVPWNLSSPLMSSTAGHNRSIGAAVKAGIIGGSLAGILLFLIVGLLVYYRRSNTQTFSRGAGIDSNGAVKAHRMWSPCAAYFAFHDHLENAPPGTSFSADFLLQRPGKASASSKYRGVSKDAGNSWRIAGKAETVDPLKPRGMEMSPSGTRKNVYNEPSRSGEESTQAESPVVLKVRSPDRLAGDLHFLDKSLKFSAEELSRAPAEVLGRSSHGTSYKATLDNGHVLTVKWLREGLAKSKKEFSREAKKFAKVRHPNLIPLRGYYWGPREHEKLILSDFVSTGSLAAHFADRTGQRYAPISWKQRLEIVVDIARGLLYLHEERHLPHGNLKATNVLLDGPNLSGRLADYSLHQLMTCEGTANQILNAGALGYRAPELATMRNPRPSTKGDVYAFGVLMLEVLTGKGAGDIISGQSGAVDLTDWVRLLATEIRTMDCFDPVLVGLEGNHEPPKGMHDMLAMALKCISQLPVDRPHIRSVFEELTSIAV